CTDLAEITTIARRAAALTTQLLTFSRQQPSQPRLLDLNAIVGRLESMLRRTIGEHIEMSTRLAPRLEAIEADPSQIEQVVMTLVVNARDAMSTGGRLEIRTSNVDVDAGLATELGIVARRYVLLAGDGDGCGMDR